MFLSSPLGYSRTQFHRPLVFIFILIWFRIYILIIQWLPRSILCLQRISIPTLVFGFPSRLDYAFHSIYLIYSFCLSRVV
uniref:Uncharacterized protein n=1 Tax=Utricularia reniformis TaxID=192314 RepID=A0A1Y0AZZ8_9LAMI|nr:hypothetical protein AEK19_MT0480 [Utricularia reniformis]ART30737.1 hypothetical protein AEK19_MT0480 [Utricularia reniformis]